MKESFSYVRRTLVFVR